MSACGKFRPEKKAQKPFQVNYPWRTYHHISLSKSEASWTISLHTSSILSALLSFTSVPPLIVADKHKSFERDLNEHSISPSQGRACRAYGKMQRGSRYKQSLMDA